MANQGGCVVGLSLATSACLRCGRLVECFKKHLHFTSEEAMYEAIAGYGLGSSSIALFGRVGGGIYTEAASVGADPSGRTITVLRKMITGSRRASQTMSATIWVTRRYGC